MTDSPTPNWQPITALPLVAQMIDETLESARIQLENLEEARPRPYVLDDALVSRIVRSYSDQAEFLPVYQEQLARWGQLDLTAGQRSEVERLKTQVDSLRGVLGSILTLASELKPGTVDTILRKSDLEVALDFLSRNSPGGRG
jgi:hypothetical protein